MAAPLFPQTLGPMAFNSFDRTVLKVGQFQLPH